MTTNLTALARLHDGLEEGAEDSGRDAGPIEARTGKKSFTHIAVEICKIESFGEEVAVYVAESREGFIEVPLAFFLGSVEDIEEAGEMKAEVGTVGGGAVLEKKGEGLPLEDAGVFRKQAEENADEKTFELVAGVTAGFEGVVETTHDFDGLEVNRVLFGKLVLFVTGNESEILDVLVKIG